MTTFRALRALYWLYDHRNQSQPELPVEVVPREDARAVYDELVSQGAIKNTLTFGGGPDGSFDFYLTANGRVQGRNAHDTYRHELALRRVLEQVATSGWDPDRLQHSEAGNDFSGRLTADEIRDATHYLVAIGLCEGSKRADSEFYQVSITPSGRAAVRRPNLIDEGSAPNTSITNISVANSGTVGNQAVGGHGHTMTATVTQGASLDEVLAAIGQLRDNVQAAPGISEDDRTELIEEIDTLTAKASRRGLAWAKAALLALGMELATTGGQELANQAQGIVSLIG